MGASCAGVRLAQQKGGCLGTIFQVFTDCRGCKAFTSPQPDPDTPLPGAAAHGAVTRTWSGSDGSGGREGFALRTGKSQNVHLHAKHREANAESCFGFQCMFILVLYLFQASAYYMDIIHVGYLNSGA